MGRQADVESDAAVVEARENLPNRSGDGLLAAITDVVGEEPLFIYVHRPDVVSQAVSFWRAVQTRVWRGRPDPVRDARATYHAGAIAHVVTMLRAQNEGWRNWFADEDVKPMEIPYPVLWRNLTQVVAAILEALGLDRGWLPSRCWNARPTSALTSGSTGTVPMPRSTACQPDRKSSEGLGKRTGRTAEIRGCPIVGPMQQATQPCLALTRRLTVRCCCRCC